MSSNNNIFGLEYRRYMRALEPYIQSIKKKVEMEGIAIVTNEEMRNVLSMANECEIDIFYGVECVAWYEMGMVVNNEWTNDNNNALLFRIVTKDDKLPCYACEYTYTVDRVNERLRLVNKQFVLTENRLFCDHSSSKPCDECISSITGNVRGMTGNISGIIGDVSGIIGDVSGIAGDVSGIECGTIDIIKILRR